MPRDAAWNFGLFAALTDPAEADGFAPAVDAELRDVAEDSKVGLLAEIQVLWDDLQPAAGVTVGAATTFTRHEGTSNQDGTATLGPLVGCPLTVSALSCSGYALQRTDRCDVSPLRTVLTLRKGRTLRGRVVDGEGKPVASVPVSIRAEKARFMQAANCVTATTSDATGAFGFQDLQDTLHTLVARPAGRPEVEVKNVAPGPTEVVMVLREQGGTIVGQAVNAKGDAVSSFSLSIVRSPVGAATREPRVVKHAEGRFEENGLPAGLYDVFVATAGGGAVARGVEVKEGARSSEVVLVASLQKSVDGTVVGLASGRPLGGLPVALNCGESRLSSTTAADGSFRFDGAPAGLCALVVAENQPGFIVSNIPLDLSGTEARRAIGRLPLVEAAEPENSPAKSAGIGAQVRDMGGKFTVMAVRPGSAADLAGLNPVAWFARDDLLATWAAGIAGASGCAQRVASHTRLLDRTGVAVRGSAPPPDVPGRDQNEPESGGRQEHKRRRLDYLTHLYDDMGFRGVEARRRAITTYGAFLGSVQIALLGDKSLRTKAQLERQVALFEELLIPKPELG